MHRHALITPVLLLALLLCAATARAAAGVNEFEGLIEPFEIVNVGSPVEGVVAEVLVERSGLVRRGDPLVRLSHRWNRPRSNGPRPRPRWRARSAPRRPGSPTPNVSTAA